MSRRANALLAAQLLALALLGGLTVVKTRVWSVADEAAHTDYVQTVAEERRLPRIDDVNHWEVRAIFYGTYPARSDADPRQVALVGRSYEAFQPPLYYLAAAPAFAVPSDYRDKVRALRWFDVLLLLLSAVPIVALARALLGERWRLGAAAGLALVLLPGVVLRGVTVSPSALELLVVTALLAALAKRRLLAAGVLVAACVLTKSTLIYVLPVWLFAVAAGWRRGERRSALLSLAMAAVLVAPWLVSNLVRYDSLTAVRQAQAQQQHVINPGRTDYGLDQLLTVIGDLPDAVLSYEWEGQLSVWWVKGLCVVLAVALAAAWLALLARGTGRRGVLLLTGAPLATGIVLLGAALVASDWPTLLGRYLYAALPAFAVGLVAAAPPRWAWRGVLAVTAVTGLLWIDVAGAFFFTNVGDALGI